MKQLRAEELQDFIKEASLLSKLKHPNIVQFFGIFKNEKGDFMIMEFVKRGSLLKLLRGKTKLTERDLCCM